MMMVKGSEVAYLTGVDPATYLPAAPGMLLIGGSTVLAYRADQIHYHNIIINKILSVWSFTNAEVFSVSLYKTTSIMLVDRWGPLSYFQCDGHWKIVNEAIVRSHQLGKKSNINNLAFTNNTKPFPSNSELNNSWSFVSGEAADYFFFLFLVSGVVIKKRK